MFPRIAFSKRMLGLTYARIAGLRTIPLIRDTLNRLWHIRADQQKAWSLIGAPAPDFYVCGHNDEQNRPYNPTQLGKDFAAFCSMNGFDCTFHMLRHTFATLMIASGVDVRTVASYLGHANPSMTLDLYASVDPDAKRAAVGRIQAVFSEGFAARETAKIASGAGVAAPAPAAADTLLATQAPPPGNPALALLMSDQFDKLDDSEKLALLNLARKVG
ncbi:MAG: site-specific integrase [Coriobacteriia bacterium]|nr:site-specific integrase [Coriobacteriia bacterium]